MTAVFRGVKYIMGGRRLPVAVPPLCASSGARSRGSTKWALCERCGPDDVAMECISSLHSWRSGRSPHYWRKRAIGGSALAGFSLCCAA